MRELTLSVAKPALKCGAQTLIERLVSQCSKLPNMEEVFINCSYMAQTIVQALQNRSHSNQITYLWEKEIMGASWTLKKVAENSSNDLLVLHGDLYLEYSGLEKFVLDAVSKTTSSSIATHSREISRARSKIEIDWTDRTVLSFEELRKNDRGVMNSGDSPQVWSNSGIYYFRRNHLREFPILYRKVQPLSDSILPMLISERNLVAFPFNGKRLAVETPDDLQLCKDF